MKFLKNIVLTLGLLCGFIQANAMESKAHKVILGTVNKVFLGTWTNETNNDVKAISFNNPSRFRDPSAYIALGANNFREITIPAKSTITINKELNPFLTTFSKMARPGESNINVVNFDNRMELNFSVYYYKVVANLIDTMWYIETARVKLPKSTERFNVYINGTIINDHRNSKTPIVSLTAQVAETPSLKEQSMKATIQKLKKEGKNLEEAKQIIPHDLHDLLLENW